MSDVAAPVAPTASQQINAPVEQFMKQFNLEALMPKEEAPAPEVPAKAEAAPATETPAVEAPAVEVPEVEAAPETPAPEAPAADAPRPVEVADKTKLATTFKVFDKEGEMEIPALEITFTANGKERREPLDKVVRLAERGFYNEEREQQNIQTRADNQRVTQENAALKQYVEAVQADITALLADEKDELYLSLKAQYAQQNTPEAQRDRLKAQLDQVTSQQKDAALLQQVRAFAEPLQQHLTSLSALFPEVPNEEIIGRFTVLTAPYLQAGRVPPSAFQQVAQLVDQELTPWVQHTHDSRLAAKTTQQQVTQERIKRETQVATSKAVLAKRQLTRALPGTAGTTPTKLRETPQAPKYKTANDILKDIPRLVQSG